MTRKPVRTLTLPVLIQRVCASSLHSMGLHDAAEALRTARKPAAPATWLPAQRALVGFRPMLSSESAVIAAVTAMASGTATAPRAAAHGFARLHVSVRSFVADAVDEQGLDCFEQSDANVSQIVTEIGGAL